MLSVVTEVSKAIAGAIAGVDVRTKAGKSILQPTVADALRSAGFIADEEDTGQLLRSGMPVWRSKDDNAVVPTKG